MLDRDVRGCGMTEEPAEGSEIREPEMIGCEGVHDHRDAVRLEPGGFNHGGGSTVEELIAQGVRWRVGAAQKIA